MARLREILLPWDSQPQGSAEKKEGPGYPTDVFCAGLGGVLLSPGGALVGSVGASDSFVVDRFGRAFRGVNSANHGLNFGAVQPIKSLQWTVLILANPSNSGTQILFSQRNGSSPFNQVTIGANVNKSLALRAGGIGCAALAASGSGSDAVTSSTSLADGGFHVFAVSRLSTGALNIYFDGVLATLDGGEVTGTGPTFSTAQQTRIGNLGSYASSGYVATCDIPLALVFDGQTLSAAQHFDWAKSILGGEHRWAEDQRIFIQAVAGGVPTLSLPTYMPGSLTSTGFRPRVTAT